jgi:hypothetical protein
MEMAIVMVVLLLPVGDGRLRRCRHCLFHIFAFSTPVMERYYHPPEYFFSGEHARLYNIQPRLGALSASRAIGEIDNPPTVSQRANECLLCSSVVSCQLGK